MKLTDTFHCIPTGWVNMYLAEDDDGLTLFDAGMPWDMDKVFSYLSRIKRHQSDIKRIVVTHGDIDHAGALARIYEHTGAQIFAGEATVEFLTTGRSPAHLPRFAAWVMNFWKYRPVLAAAVETVTDGDSLPVLGGLSVLATPGHTLDHHSFFSPSTGILIVGDALNNNGKQLKVTPKAITADLEAARQSAIRLLQLTPTILACGHGPPLMNHTDDVLTNLYRQLV